jgi:hypothetical protein
MQPRRPSDFVRTATGTVLSAIERGEAGECEGWKMLDLGVGVGDFRIEAWACRILPKGNHVAARNGARNENLRFLKNESGAKTCDKGTIRNRICDGNKRVTGVSNRVAAD